MHPDSEPTSLAGDWRSEIHSSDEFTRPVVKSYPWSQDYTRSQYTLLLQTHQHHIPLQDAQRAALLDAVANAIDAAGGILTMPFITRLCLATRR
jgi:hypothetical protein